MNEANKFDSTILKTLKFLGAVLRTEKFTLRNIVNQRKKIQKQEANSRAKIKNLMNKIQNEFDLNSKLKEIKNPESDEYRDSE